MRYLSPSMSAIDARIPVTVLTGFLGAGKTTLLNRILTGQHGRRIAIIENEFGEIGIDHELVVQADEEIFEMNNGCLCCTVRGDLIRVLGQLHRRRHKFDYVLVETTGLADPGPVAQTFFNDPEVKEHYRLDGIVTVVDAKHLHLHIDDAPEAKRQIAFADRLLINKVDLVAADALAELQRRVRGVNAVAQLFPTTHANLAVDQVIDLRAFDLDHKLSVDGDFLDRELPFEWSGAYRLERGEYQLAIEPGPDSVMGVALLRLAIPKEENGGSEDHHHEHGDLQAEGEVHAHDPHDPAHGALHEAEELAAALFDQTAVAIRPGEAFQPGPRVYKLMLGEPDTMAFRVLISESGHYALFTQHGLDERGGRLEGPRGQLAPDHVHAHGGHSHHHHDETVSSVGIEERREADPKRLNTWLSELLATKGQDIYRMKGILNLKGVAERFVFQGVHMTFEGKADRRWREGETRKSQLVFIGRNLDRDALNAGFRRCLA